MTRTAFPATVLTRSLKIGTVNSGWPQGSAGWRTIDRVGREALYEAGEKDDD